MVRIRCSDIVSFSVSDRVMDRFKVWVRNRLMVKFMVRDSFRFNVRDIDYGLSLG